MTQLLKKMAFKIVFCLCLFLISCSGTSGVGVIVNKPSPPTLNLFPNMDDYVPTTALGIGEAASSTSTNQALVLSDGVTLEDLFNAVFRERGVAEKDIIQNQLQDIGEAIASATLEAGHTELDENLVTISLSAPPPLIEISPDVLDVSMMREATDDDYSRFYFILPETGTIHATYVVKSDASGQAVRGLFGYAKEDPTAVNDGNDIRFFTFAYDVTDTTQAELVFQEDRYSPSLDRHFVNLVYIQCNQGETSTDCVGEFLEIVTDPPTRTFSQFTSRFSWNESSQVICIAEADHTSGTGTVFGTSSQLTGPIFDSSTMTENTCSVATTYDEDGTPFPLWGDHIFTTDDLIMRYEDTDPVGGSVIEYYGDGTSLDAWNALTPALIDTFLRP